MFTAYFILSITLYNALGGNCAVSVTPRKTNNELNNTKDYNELELGPKLFGFFAAHKFNKFVVKQTTNGTTEATTTTTTSTTTTTTTTLDPVAAREMLCNDFGGKIINETLCYEYVNRERYFDDAVTYCSDKGGQLWVPNIYDPKLSFILFDEFPEIYDEVYSVFLWIGIELDDDNFLSITGENFDEHPLLNPFLNYEYYYYYFDERCVGLWLVGNKFELYPDYCYYTFNFVCEYEV